MSGNVDTLKQRIDEAEQCSEIVSVLDMLAPLLAENTSSQELYDLLVDAFQALRTLTSENMSEGEQVILAHLLNHLEKDSDGTAIQKSATRQIRECLEVWIAQYSEREGIVLRQHILDDLLERFRMRPSYALCWTFAHIGYREQRLAEALWDFALHNEDEKGETALVTLTALGVPLPERPRLLEILHRKIQSQVTQSLLIALSRLADPTSLDVVRNIYFLPLHTAQATITNNLEFMLALRVIISIIDTHDEDEDLQNRAWMLITELHSLEHIAPIVNLWGSIVPLCNSRHVIPTLLTWLEQASGEKQQQYCNLLLPYQLKKWIRPRQVVSWCQDSISTAIPILRQLACQDTHAMGRYATHEMHTKEAAWEILLCLGCFEALGWFEEAVSKETNPYLCGELYNLFACFCPDHLPNDVLASITKPYDAKLPDPTGQTSAEIIVRLGAVKVVQSAASRQAFEILLDCGLTFGGHPPLASVEALADVTCALARKGELILVVERLVETVVQHSRPACRLAAARALETLASEQEIPLSRLKPLLDVLLNQQDRDSFECSIIISILGMQQNLPDILLPLLKQWAQERDDELAVQSFSILAQRGLLLTEETLLKRLGLSPNEALATTVFNRSDWRAHIIGLLYMSHPETFVSLAAHLIETLPWASAIKLIGKLNTSDRDHNQQSLPHELAATLIQRVQQRQTRMGAELDLIHLTAHLIPEDLALEPWDHAWQDWLPDARAAIADALGALHRISDAAHAQRVKLLQMLMSDGHYQVRRAAYRGLHRCATPILQQWCWTWTWSDERSLRLYAAEACAWLLPEGEQESIYTILFDLLATDPEPEVRQAALRTQQERRKRLWAQEYLTHVMQAIQSTTISNTQVLDAWPYAEALKHVGDDTTLQTLRDAVENYELPPHIRHWCKLLLKETHEGWEKAMKKWPQPGNMWTGSLEVGHGMLLTSSERITSVQYTVWRNDPLSLTGTASWGGTLQVARILDLWSHEQLSLQLEDGRRGEIFLKETNAPKNTCVFVGQGMFPY